jgi:hypothetical protein
VYSVVDLFCGHRAISKAFENRGLKSMAHDVCINVLDVPMVAIWGIVDITLKRLPNSYNRLFNRPVHGTHCVLYLFTNPICTYSLWG